MTGKMKKIAAVFIVMVAALALSSALVGCSCTPDKINASIDKDKNLVIEANGADGSSSLVTIMSVTPGQDITIDSDLSEGTLILTVVEGEGKADLEEGVDFTDREEVLVYGAEGVGAEDVYFEEGDYAIIITSSNAEPATGTVTLSPAKA